MNCQKGLLWIFLPKKTTYRWRHVPVGNTCTCRLGMYTCRMRVTCRLAKAACIRVACDYAPFFLANFCIEVLSGNSLVHVVLYVKYSNITAHELRLHSPIPERRYTLLIKFILYILLNQIVPRLFHIREIPKAVWTRECDSDQDEAESYQESCQCGSKRRERYRGLNVSSTGATTSHDSASSMGP
jgi:hypothetical protein